MTRPSDAPIILATNANFDSSSPTYVGQPTKIASIVASFLANGFLPKVPLPIDSLNRVLNNFGRWLQHFDDISLESKSILVTATSVFDPTAYPHATHATFYMYPPGGGGGHGSSGSAGGGGGGSGKPAMYQCRLTDFFGPVDITIGAPGQGGVFPSTIATSGGDITIVDPGSGLSIVARGGTFGQSATAGTGGVGGQGYCGGGGAGGGGFVDGGQGGEMRQNIIDGRGAPGSGGSFGAGGESPMAILSDFLLADTTGSQVFFPIPFFTCAAGGVGGTGDAGLFVTGGGGGGAGFLTPTTFGNTRVHTAQGESGKGYGGGGGGGTNEQLGLNARNGLNGCPGCVLIVLS